MSQINFDVLKIEDYANRPRRHILDKAFTNKITIRVVASVYTYTTPLVALNDIRIGQDLPNHHLKKLLIGMLAESLYRRS